MEMRASRSRTRDATNLLTSTPDEAALVIACSLLTARDLLSLCLVCRRFNIRCIAIGGGGGAGYAVARGGRSAAVRGEVQRAGARLGAAARYPGLAVLDA